MKNMIIISNGRLSFILLMIVLYNSPTIVLGQNELRKKEILAILSIDSRGINAENSSIRDMVQLEAEKANVYSIMDKYDIADLLSKNSINIEECYGKTCLVEIGKLLKADKMLTGNIEKMGDRIVMTFRIIDVKSELIEQTETGEYLNLPNEIHKMVRISLNNLFSIENDENLVNMLVDYDTPIVSPKNALRLNGPRMGVSYTTGAVAERLQASKSQGGYEMFPLITQFGYQWETQYLSAGSFQALIEIIGLVGGLESGKFIPSISLLNGFRSSINGWEFAFGPTFKLVKTASGYYDENNDWHLEFEWDNSTGENPYEIQELPDSRGYVKLSTNLVLAVGKTFKSGYLNIPVNVYVVPNKKGTTIGASVGFNINKRIN